MANFPTNLEVPFSELDERLAAGKKRRPPSIAVQAHATAYMSCLMEVDVWMRWNAKNENCMVIVEDNNEARAVIRQVHRYHQSSSMLLTEDLRKFFPLRCVREDPAFQEKRPDHPLVLADFVAFVMKRVYMKDQRIAPFYKPWKNRIAVLAVEDGAPPED